MFFLSEYAIQVNSLSKIYNNVAVIDDLTFEVKSNGIFGLLGRNGAGKTTLLGILMGLITPSTGEIFLLGENIEEKKYTLLKKINFQSPYVVLPKKLDEEVASLMVEGFGGTVTQLTEEQADYINVPKDGPFKEESYKY